MKKIIFAFALALSTSCFALDVDNFDNSQTDGETEAVSIDALGWSTNIKGEIMVFNPEGSRFLYSYNERREWNFGGSSREMTNIWSFKAKGIPDLYLVHTWTLAEDGSLSVKLSQYESMGREGSSSKATPGKLIREENFKVENLMPITWEFFKDKEKRVVVRFDPGVWTDDKPIDLGKYPINGKGMVVYDSKGKVWASRLRNTEGINTYFGVETGHGSFFISLSPFKGAQEIGFVKRATLQIKTKDGLKIKMQSESPFVAEGVIGKVYGIIDLNRKSGSEKRVRTWGYDDVGAFQNKIVGK
jgi:hypothetical protein